jgi:large subunit ribosomal protein L35
MTKSKITAKKIRNAMKTAPKIKTKRAAAKRYKVTGSGKIKVPHCGKQHNASTKNRSRKTRLKKIKVARAEKRILIYRCLPNSF